MSNSNIILKGVDCFMLKRRLVSALLAGAVVVLAFGPPAVAASTETPTGGSVYFSNSQITPFTIKNIDGGTWNYGSSIYKFVYKRVWSNYQHQDLTHRSSCYLGDRYDNSGWQDPGTESKSSIVGGLLSEAAMYYDIMR